MVNALANDCFPPGVSGIALMLITVRVGLGWAHSAGGSQQVSGTSFIRSAFSRPERGPRESLPMHAISLNVSTTVERETDYGLETPGADQESRRVAEGQGRPWIRRVGCTTYYTSKLLSYLQSQECTIKHGHAVTSLAGRKAVS